MAEEEVILVNEHDHAIGSMEKLAAHQQGALHRAFSVFIFNSKGDMLLQQRALDKYHSAGLWTNTCCSHPRPGEGTLPAAIRRLKEEMGLETELHQKGSFLYKAEFDNGLTEHEFDYVFTGTSDEQPLINRLEVNDYAWLSPETIRDQLDKDPGKFTAWFRIAMAKWF